MFERITHHWPEIILSLFAVAAGQIGRLGQKLDRGERVGWRHVVVELSMFPAFGSLTGVFGIQMGWPIWLILGVGIAAGWLGFFTFRILAKIMLGLLKVVTSSVPAVTDADLPPDPPPSPPPSPPRA